MEKLLNEDKLLDKYEVMKILNIAEDTAIKKMREINDELKRKNKNIMLLKKVRVLKIR